MTRNSLFSTVREKNGETQITASASHAGGMAVGGGAGFGAGSNLTINGGLLQILQGFIGGSVIATDHGTTTFLNGNLSITDPTNSIRSGVIDENGTPLFEFHVTAGIILPPYMPIEFTLTIGGVDRHFNAITDETAKFLSS